jgi:hypothetical protein
MSERSEKLVEIAKAAGFVIIGFFGGIAATGFVDGFRDGFNEAQRDDRVAEQSAGPTDSADPN